MSVEQSGNILSSGAKNTRRFHRSKKGGSTRMRRYLPIFKPSVAGEKVTIADAIAATSGLKADTSSNLLENTVPENTVIASILSSVVSTEQPKSLAHSVIETPSEAITVTQLVDPETAVEWVTKRNYKGQRIPRMDRVLLLEEAMRRNEFQQYGTLRFECKDGQEYLVDGQHRLLALARAGIPQWFVVVMVDVPSEEAIAESYSKIDIHRRRTERDSFRAHSLGDELGLSDFALGKIGPAINLISTHFMSMKRPPNPLRKIEEIREWKDEAVLFWQAWAGSHRSMYLAHSAPSVSVAMVLLRYQREKAFDFLHRVYHNNGLMSGTPEHKLATMFMTTNVERLGQALYARKIAACWNLHYEGKVSRNTRPRNENSPIYLAGTPYTADRTTNPPVESLVREFNKRKMMEKGIDSGNELEDNLESDMTGQEESDV